MGTETPKGFLDAPNPASKAVLGLTMPLPLVQPGELVQAYLVF